MSYSIQSTDMSRKDFFKGTTFALAGVVVFSFDAYLIRVSGVSGFLSAFWRGVFTAISLALLFFTTNRDRSIRVLKQGGKPLLLSGLLWGLSGICFTSGVQNAGAANTLVLLSLAPLFTAIFEAVVYRVKPSQVTIIASLIAIFGVGVIYRGGLQEASVEGMVFASLTPVVFGINLSNLRRHHHISRVAACMLGGVVGALFSLAILGCVVRIPTASLLPLAVLGLFVIPFGQTMISTGTRYISAVETALIQSLETVFGVAYVWLLLGEAPGLDFLIGGTLVIAGIIYNALFHARRL
jgi:drug/metabolite transporter (DMT)-like permease